MNAQMWIRRGALIALTTGFLVPVDAGTYLALPDPDKARGYPAQALPDHRIVSAAANPGATPKAPCLGATRLETSDRDGDVGRNQTAFAAVASPLKNGPAPAAPEEAGAGLEVPSDPAVPILPGARRAKKPPRRLEQPAPPPLEPVRPPPMTTHEAPQGPPLLTP